MPAPRPIVNHQEPLEDRVDKAGERLRKRKAEKAKPARNRDAFGQPLISPRPGSATPYGEPSGR